MNNNPIVDNQKAPISEETYNMFKQGLKDWVEQDLKWKRDEIVSFHFENEILDDGYEVGENGKKWTKKKLGKHVDVTIERGTQEKHLARFERVSDGSWKKKDEWNVSPLR